MKPGDLLISHPRWEPTGRVCLITHVRKDYVLGLELNTPQGRVLEEYGVEDTVHYGGPTAPKNLIMLHDSTWTSSDTIHLSEDWSVSSDELMLIKLEMGNTPQEYKLMLGQTVWDTRELADELISDKPSLLWVESAPYDLVMCDHLEMYDRAVELFTQQQMDMHFS